MPGRGLVLRGLMVACAAEVLGGCTPGPIEVETVTKGALTDGLVAHWPLYEGSGTATADTSGNEHNGVLQGPGWNWVTGHFDWAVHFSGMDLISVPSFPRAGMSYTVSAWTYIAPTELGPPIQNLISTEVVGGGWALFIEQAPGSPPAYAFEYADNPNPSALLVTASCGCVATNAWVHLTAVLDGQAQSLTLYVGTMPQMTVPAPLPILAGSTTLNIGHSTRQEPGSAFPVTGIIDDVTIYNRALEAQEIAQLDAAIVPDQR